MTPEQEGARCPTCKGKRGNATAHKAYGCSDPFHQAAPEQEAGEGVAQGDGCPFCDYQGPSEVIRTTRHAFIIEPINPVVPGHLLAVPHHHVTDWIGTGSPNDEAAIIGTLLAAQDYAHEADWGDCNLITSKGDAATQTVGHLHFHLIPRREGDGLALPWTRDPAPSPHEGEAARAFRPDVGDHTGHLITRVGETRRYQYLECECGEYWRCTSDAAEDRSREKHRWG